MEDDRREDGRFVYAETDARRIALGRELCMLYMAPYHGAETTMYHTSLVHNPDHVQALEYHQERLAKAEQARLAREATKARKGGRPASHALGFLRHLFLRRQTQRFPGTVSHPGVHT